MNRQDMKTALIRRWKENQQETVDLRKQTEQLQEELTLAKGENLSQDEYLKLVAEGGLPVPGAPWDMGVRYLKYSIVLSDRDGNYYRAKVSTQGQAPHLNPSAWEKVDLSVKAVKS
jgi:hypothetical protein